MNCRQKREKGGGERKDLSQGVKFDNSFPHEKSFVFSNANKKT